MKKAVLAVFCAILLVLSLSQQAKSIEVRFDTLSTFFYAQSSYFFNSTSGLIGCEGGIVKTTNGGTTFDTTLNSNYDIYSITFDESVGYALKRNAWPQVPTLIRTADGGRTWEQFPLPYDFQQICAKHGQLVGLTGGNKLYRSLNGGGSWQLLQIFELTAADSIANHKRTEELNAITDPGFNKERVMTISTIEWDEVAFYYTSTTNLWKSTDLFAWTALHPPVQAISGQSSSQNGLIKMVSGRNFTTGDDCPAYAFSKDGGLTWEFKTCTTEIGDASYALWTERGVFVGVTNGSFIYPISQLYHVEQGNWTKLLDGYMAFVGMVHRDNKLIATGYLSEEFPSSFIATIDLTVTQIQPSANVPDDYILRQNFPNPFNPTTMIAYSLPVRSAVRLSIYDMSGKKIQEIVNGFQNAGSYSVNFNGANLSSGTYFYSLEANGLRETKKMLLVK